MHSFISSGFFDGIDGALYVSLSNWKKYFKIQ